MKVAFVTPFVVIFFLGQFSLLSQTKEAGPVIREHGNVWKVPNLTYKTDVNKEFRVVFDVMDSPKSVSELNKSLETAARFLNMHAQDGVPQEQLKVALVVHNKAAKDLLSNEAYQKRYKTQNPNASLVQALLDQDVQIILCGQSSLSRRVPIENTIPGVQLALSAMTALLQLQDQGYQLIKF